MEKEIYKCEICGKEYKSQKNLNNHIKNKHSEEIVEELQTKIVEEEIETKIVKDKNTDLHEELKLFFTGKRKESFSISKTKNGRSSKGRKTVVPP